MQILWASLIVAIERNSETRHHRGPTTAARPVHAAGPARIHHGLQNANLG